VRAVVQRVKRAAVRVLDGPGAPRVSGEIGPGLVVLLGVAAGDGEREAAWMAEKVANLRIFEDEAGKMNRSAVEVGAAVLAVSQFTLLGCASRGRRPDFTAAARPEVAEPLYERFCEAVAARGVPVARGVFRAGMEVELVNDGPVTIIIDSERRP
jgi:D-tyrosyl-tRNA(Tyr) deacylase